LVRAFFGGLTFRFLRTILPPQMRLAIRFKNVLIVTIAANFIRTGARAGCKGRLAGLATVSIAANFIAALIMTAALCGRKITAIVFIFFLVFAIAAQDMTGGSGGNDIVGRRNRTRLTPWSAEIRQDFLGLNLALAQGGEIVGYGFFLVKADLASVGAHETFIEDSTGKLVEVFVFESTQHARADFCGVRDGIERETTLLALLAKFFPKRSQGPAPAGVVRSAPASRR
jgi:hypothetical protein